MNLLRIFLWIPMAAAITINCNFTEVGFAHLGSQYTCQVQNLQNATADTSVDGINGVHTDGKSHDDVTALATSNQNSHFMPKRFEKFFKNIRGIIIYKSGLKFITKEDLKPFPMLKTLYIIENKLTVIQPDLFEFNPKLTFIELNDNRIRSIAPGTFDAIDDLEELHMTGNVCISKGASDRKGVNEVEREILKECQAHKDTEEILMKIQNLKKLVEQLRFEIEKIGVFQ